MLCDLLYNTCCQTVRQSGLIHIVTLTEVQSACESIFSGFRLFYIKLSLTQTDTDIFRFSYLDSHPSFHLFSNNILGIRNHFYDQIKVYDKRVKWVKHKLLYLSEHSLQAINYSASAEELWLWKTWKTQNMSNSAFIWYIFI